MIRKHEKQLPLLGAHFSIAKGLENALKEAASYGCNSLQMFTKNATTWKEKVLSEEMIARFLKAKTETGIERIAAHTSYLINPAAVEKKKLEMSRNALKQELIRCTQLFIPYVVLHPGAHMGKGEAAGVARIADSINRVFEDLPNSSPRLLLETTAGQGTGLGHSFEQLGHIMDKIMRKDRIGICLDTCHIFAAGYDIRTGPAYERTIRRFDAVIGLDHLYMIHLNDSKRDLGARVDRHTHIGRGAIGEDGFGFIMKDSRFDHIPKIIETEKEADGRDWNRVNLACLRRLAA
jgi:deoxyribonuclease IV